MNELLEMTKEANKFAIAKFETLSDEGKRNMLKIYTNKVEELIEGFIGNIEIIEGLENQIADYEELVAKHETRINVLEAELAAKEALAGIIDEGIKEFEEINNRVNLVVDEILNFIETGLYYISFTDEVYVIEDLDGIVLSNTESHLYDAIVDAKGKLGVEV